MTGNSFRDVLNKSVSMFFRFLSCKMHLRTLKEHHLGHCPGPPHRLPGSGRSRRYARVCPNPAKQSARIHSLSGPDAPGLPGIQNEAICPWKRMVDVFYLLICRVLVAGCSIGGSEFNAIKRFKGDTATSQMDIGQRPMSLVSSQRNSPS